jgi:thiamine biosynthesis protein ThiS
LKVFIEKEGKEKTVTAKTVAEMLNKLDINSETVIVVSNDEVITEDAKLNEKDKIKILSVVSGG